MFGKCVQFKVDEERGRVILNGRERKLKREVGVVSI